MMRTGSRSWPGILGQGPQKPAVLVFVLGQKPETLGSIRDPVLARDKEFQGLWFLLLSPSDFFLLCFHRTLNDQHYLEAVHVGVAKTERYLDILDGPPGLTY